MSEATTTVQLSDQKVDVDVDLSMEQLLFMQRLASTEMVPEKSVADAVDVEELVDEMLALIDDTDPCNNRELWERYAERYGIDELAERYSVLAKPALEHIESLDVTTLNQRYGEDRDRLFG